MSNEKRRKASGARILVALSALVLLCSGAAVAAEKKAAAGNVNFHGVQVSIDPATGRLRQPTPAEAKALADSLRSMFTRSASEPQVTHHADGTLSATLGPEALNIWVATLEADGSLSQACVEGQDAAAVVLQSTTVWEEK